MKRLAPLLLLVAACATTPPAPVVVPSLERGALAPGAPCNPGISILNATLWVQSSAEFEAVAIQTFAAARRALDEALADTSRVGAVEENNEDPSQPPAVIVDVDETVLDNTGFETRVIRRGLTYDSQMWKDWTSEGIATAIPGAAEFLAYANSRGVTVFYVTNRDEDERAGTHKNLVALGFPLDPGVETLLLQEDTRDKGPRRAQVAASYRLLLLLGDDLNDFAPMREQSHAEREAMLRQTRAWWGTRWFMLPNPMYGSWERAAIGSGGTPCERLQRKVDALR